MALPIMTNADKPMSLRSVADLLVQYGLPQKRDKYGYDCLLGLLKTSQIRTIAYFPIVGAEAVPISERYWQGIGRGALNCLTRSKENDWSGTYSIKLRDVAAEAFRTARSRIVAEKERVVTEEENEQLIVRFIQHANKTASVEVLQSEWDRFLTSTGMSAAEPPLLVEAPGRPGRPVNEKWVEVLSELAAVLWRAIEEHGVKKVPSQEAIAVEIRSNLESLGQVALPQVSTIQSRIATVRLRVRQLRNLPKSE